MIEQAIAPFAADAHAADEHRCDAPIAVRADLHDPNVVKVVVDRARLRAVFLARADSACVRDAGRRRTPPVQAWRHIGLYGYRRTFLPTFRRPAADAARTGRAARAAPGARARHPHQGRARDFEVRSAWTRRRTWHEVEALMRRRRDADGRQALITSEDTRHDGEPGQHETGQIHLRDRRRRVVARQGTRRRLDRHACSRGTAIGSRSRSSTPTSTSIPAR